jgi:hypothetical protein
MLTTQNFSQASSSVMIMTGAATLLYTQNYVTRGQLKKSLKHDMREHFSTLMAKHMADHSANVW